MLPPIMWFIIFINCKLKPKKAARPNWDHWETTTKIGGSWHSKARIACGYITLKFYGIWSLPCMRSGATQSLWILVQCAWKTDCSWAVHQTNWRPDLLILEPVKSHKLFSPAKLVSVLDAARSLTQTLIQLQTLHSHTYIPFTAHIGLFTHIYWVCNVWP